MYVVIFTTAFAHSIPLHLKQLLLPTVAAGDWRNHNSHLIEMYEDVSSDEIAGMGVSLTYFRSHRCIEGRNQTECRVHEYKISICDEEGGWSREVVLPEEVDFAAGGDEVLEEDEYCNTVAVSKVVPCM